MVDGGRKLNPVDNDGSDQLPFNKLYSMTHSDLDTLFGGACYRGYLEWIGINTRVLRMLLQGTDEQPVIGCAAGSGVWGPCDASARRRRTYGYHSATGVKNSHPSDPAHGLTRHRPKDALREHMWATIAPTSASLFPSATPPAQLRSSEPRYQFQEKLPATPPLATRDV